MVSEHRLESLFNEIRCNGMTIFMELMIFLTIRTVIYTGLAVKERYIGYHLIPVVVKTWRVTEYLSES